MNSVVEQARQLSCTLLADVLPRRWAHTMGVADKAAQLAHLLDPVWADVVVAAAWLHDIGYAPNLASTGFHPIDGAAYLHRTGTFPPPLVWLVAHHTGAVFEARERGLGHLLDQYPKPDADALAVLSSADLCTAPDGVPVDPAHRIAEILTRYPSEHPVHRAITASAPLLLDQARFVLGASDAAKSGLSHVTPPERVERVRPGLPIRIVSALDIDIGNRP